jgi:hypothetical protein
MRAANLTPLLVRARDAGLSLRAEGGFIVATPKARLEPELRDEMARRKAELLVELTWDEGAAVALLEGAAEFLEAPCRRAGLREGVPWRVQQDLLEALPDGNRLVEAHVARDMGAYRIAVREWVQETRAALLNIEQARALYLPSDSLVSPRTMMREGATV